MSGPPPISLVAITLLALVLPAAVEAKPKAQKALRARLVALEELESARLEALTLIRDAQRYHSKEDQVTQRQVKLLTQKVDQLHAKVDTMLQRDVKKLRGKNNRESLEALERADPSQLNPWERALLQRIHDDSVLLENAQLAKELPKAARPNAFQLEQLALTNGYRILMGLSALRLEHRLAATAAGHSDEMRRLRYFDHQSPDPERRTVTARAKLSGFTGAAVGENIARGYRSPAAVHRGWLESPGHHRNILDPDWEVMGVAYSSNLWTQVFGKLEPSS